MVSNSKGENKMRFWLASALRKIADWIDPQVFYNTHLYLLPKSFKVPEIKKGPAIVLDKYDIFTVLIIAGWTEINDEDLPRPYKYKDSLTETAKQFRMNMTECLNSADVKGAKLKDGS
jgi:hypothetical protein